MPPHVCRHLSSRTTVCVCAPLSCGSRTHAYGRISVAQADCISFNRQPIYFVLPGIRQRLQNEHTSHIDSTSERFATITHTLHTKYNMRWYAYAIPLSAPISPWPSHHSAISSGIFFHFFFVLFSFYLFYSFFGSYSLWTTIAYIYLLLHILVIFHIYVCRM